MGFILARSLASLIYAWPGDFAKVDRTGRTGVAARLAGIPIYFDEQMPVGKIRYCPTTLGYHDTKILASLGLPPERLVLRRRSYG